MRIVSYFRVSTARQGASGLGLEGQQAAVEAYAQANGAQIVGTFTEVESGKRHQNRPQLAAALNAAKALRATLVVAKLDRLARNVAFLSALMDSDIPFIACDNPNATRLTLHILAAVAEDELSRISSRLKAAFTAGKARGRRYGAANENCKRFTAEVSRAGSDAAREANRRLAAEWCAAMLPIVEGIREGRSLEQTAEELNRAGYTTRRGRPWTLATVSQVLNGAVVEGRNS